MKGFVPTPPHCVDFMVQELFAKRPPREDQVVLDAGCGEGAFIEGIVRHCRQRALPVPRIVGVDSDAERLASARLRLGDERQVVLRQADFLLDFEETVDAVIANPPYVSILGLDEAEKAAYRQRFKTATGRFDLYQLFFEKAMTQLRPTGRLVFITPEKFTYVDSARALRRMLAANSVRKLCFVSEDMFPGLVTYPLVTVVDKQAGGAWPVVSLRDGRVFKARLPSTGDSWAPASRGAEPTIAGPELGELCLRVSCGIATGKDSLFVLPGGRLPLNLEPYAVPTLSGREIAYGSERAAPRSVMLVPYDRRGRLRPLASLGALGSYLQRPEHREQLESRTCARRKPWYAFHETPVLDEILQPKILVKDIGATPQFVLDAAGAILPRHSVYYVIPRRPDLLVPLFDYLRGPEATRWLYDHCQRAANGYVRIQSQVLKRLPVPAELVPAIVPATTAAVPQPTPA